MRLKKLISGVLAGLTAISSIPFSSAGVITSAADAEKDIWDGTIDTSWYNSGRTEFHISSPAELAGLAELVNVGNNMSGKTFILDNNIYLNDVSDFENWSSTNPANNWKPIGIYDSDKRCFSGIFDGSGYSIEGLYISVNYGYGGLFGATASSSEIRNINMTYEYINNSYSRYHYSGGISAYSRGKIRNCSTDVMSTIASNCAGGIAGYSTAEISNCSNNGSIYSSYYYYYSSSGSSYGGGIVGYSTANINNCSNNGNVNYFKYSYDDEYSYNRVGGIVGELDKSAITNCYNVASINGKYYSGGLIGYANSSTINNSYNAAEVTGSDYIGSVAGYDTDPSNLNKVYHASSIIKSVGNSKYEYAIAVSDTNMKKESFATSLGYPFVYVEGDYPKLAWEIDSIEEPTEITSETTSENTSNTENTTDISETISTSTTPLTTTTNTTTTTSIITSTAETTPITTKVVNTSEITSKTYESLWVYPQHITLGFSGSQGRIHVFGGDGNYSFSSDGFFSVTQDGIVTSNSWLPSEGTITVRDGSGMSAEVSVTIWGKIISTSTTPLTTTTNTTTTTSIITSTAETTPTTTTSSDVTTTSTTTTLPVTTMKTSTAITKGATSTEVTKLSTTITTNTTEPLKAEIDSIEIEVGEKTTIKTNQDNLIFKTSNSDVAIVSKNGVITPISAGTAIISVINSDGDSVQIKIKIKDSSLETTEKITVATTTTNKTTNLPIIKTTSVTTTIAKPTTTVTTKTNIEISVGDVNDDGAIDSKDAVFVLKSYAETLAGNVATVSIEKGDVNGDGKIDSKDAVKILKYYASTMVGYKENIVNFN